MCNKFIMANQTNHDIVWTQPGVDKSFTIKSKTQTPFHWPSNKTKAIAIKFSGSEYNFSKAFLVQDTSLFEIRVLPHHKVIIQTTTDQFNATAIIFRNPSDSFCTYIVKNDTSLPLQVQQRKSNEHPIEVKQYFFIFFFIFLFLFFLFFYYYFFYFIIFYFILFFIFLVNYENRLMLDLKFLTYLMTHKRKKN